MPPLKKGKAAARAAGTINRSAKDKTMSDVIYILVTVIFFGLAVGYTYACGRL